MTKELHRRTKHAAIAASLSAALGAVPVAAQACSDSPVISAVCLMAAVNLGSFNRAYMVANGAVLPVSQYQALYSLLGITYGGDGKTTFALPDLRGRMVLGADARVPEYAVGKNGGKATVTLTGSQLPVHAHAFSGANIDLSKVTATTTLGTLAATVSGNPTLKASAGGTSTNAPSGNSLATPTSTTRIYSDAAPTISMNAGSIDGGALKVGLSGAPATTLSGTAAISGDTATTGGSMPVPILPPYLAMTYYIAYGGTYPERE